MAFQEWYRDMLLLLDDTKFLYTTLIACLKEHWRLALRLFNTKVTILCTYFRNLANAKLRRH